MTAGGGTMRGLRRRTWLAGASAGLGWAGAWPAATLAQTPPAAPSAASGTSIPVTAFFERPLMGGARLSPDGRRVAMRVAAPGGRYRLAVLDLETRQSRIVAGIDDADVLDFDWTSDERLVFDTSMTLVQYQRVDYGPGLFSVEAAGGPVRELVETRPDYWLAGGDGTRKPLHWATAWQPQPLPPAADEVLVVRAEERNQDRFGHFQVGWLSTRQVGVYRELTQLPAGAVHWVFDPRQQLRAAVVRQGPVQSLQWAAEGGRWQVLRQFDQLSDEGWWPHLVDAQGQLWVSATHQGRAAVFTLDPASGRLADRPVAAHPLFDIAPRFITRAGRVFGLRYTIDAEVTQWFDDDAKALQAELDKRLPGLVNRITLPQHGDSPWVQVDSWSDQQPVRALAYHRGQRQFLRLGDSRPAIDARRMAQTDLVQIKARDGLVIPAWLTLPPGGVKKNLPLVVWVHGGPWSRGMSWRWHPEVQFLASRGYAVLQPELRGSAGYGHAHFRAGWRQWGQAMQTDLADAARWAIDQGVADPKRIALLGGSYGGYATLMGLIQEPGLFRAGVAHAAVTDLHLLFDLRWSDMTQETRLLGLTPLVGDRVADAAMLAAHSPLQQARALKQPLMLVHGAWDARVPADHASARRDALKPHLAELDWVLVPEEGHGWHKPENEQAHWTRVERFLARHLAPG